MMLVLVSVVVVFSSHVSVDELNVEELSKTLKSVSPVEVANIFYKLGRDGKDSSPAIPLLVKYLDDDRNGLTQAIPDDSSVGYFASRALIQIGSPALPALMSTLSQPDSSDIVKERCIEAIGEIGCRSKQAEELLIKVGKSSGDERIVFLTLGSLESVFVDEMKVGQHIIQFLDHENSNIQVQAIRVAGKLQFQDKDLERKLVKKINDDIQFFDRFFSRFNIAPTVNLEAIRSLAEFPKIDKETLELLEGLLTDKQLTVAIEAARAVHLQSKMNQKGILFMKGLLQLGSVDTEVLGYALETAGRLEKDARMLEPEVQRLLLHSDSRIRIAAIKAMVTINIEKATLNSEMLLGDENEYVRYAAYQAVTLARVEIGRAIVIMKRGFNDESQRNQELVLAWFSELETHLDEASILLREFRENCEEIIRPEVDKAIDKIDARR